MWFFGKEFSLNDFKLGNGYGDADDLCQSGYMP
jgi:hypothetical protein